MARLGIATIGQAPRDDIAALFARFLPQGSSTVLRGCLDGVEDDELAARPPESGDDTLYTRLRGERDVLISKHHVIERAPATLAALRRDGCDAIVFACTCEFPPLPGEAGVLFPSRVLSGVAHGLLPEGRLGLLVPLAEQRGKLMAKWARPGLEVVAEPLIPSADADAAAAAARRLASLKPDLIAMDCMSYTEETKLAVRRAAGVPTLLAITATGRVLQELLS